MNILFLEDSTKSIFGGGQKISSYVLNFLNNTKLRIYYFDFKVNKILQSNLTSIENKTKVLLHYSKINNISFFINILCTFLNCLILIWYSIKYNFGVIYSTNKRTLFYAFLLNFICNKPFIYHAHMLMQNKWYDFLVIFAIKRAKHCVCVSEYVEIEYKKIGLLNTILIANPIENNIVFKQFSYLRKNKFNISFFGSINSIKGVKYLLDSIKYLNGFDVTLTIYGEGNELEKYMSIYANNDKIIFHGFTNDVIAKIDETDILILPTIIPEAAPTIIQQAMSRGVPVITTNIGGQKYFIKDKINGILVKPKCSKEIANAILIFLKDQEFYKFVSLNNSKDSLGFKKITHFNKQILTLFS
jgi:glycosyltransferase involved in cell wall biosynthesis